MSDIGGHLQSKVFGRITLSVNNNKSIYLLAIYIKTCIPKHEHKFDMNI